MRPFRTRPALLEVLVAGASGFLGNAICEELAACGMCPVRVARARPSAMDYASNPRFIDALRRQPFALIHAAGGASVAGSVAHPQSDFRNGVVLFETVLEAVRQFAPGCRVLLLSSAAVYGNPDTLPVDERQPLEPISPYGYHKLIAEQMGRMYQELYGVPFGALRIFSAYGLGLKRQAIYEIAQKLWLAHGGRVELYGTGHESRDFVHRCDVARATVRVLQRGDLTGEAYNVGSGLETGIRDLALILRQELGSTATLTFDGRVREGDPVRWQADIGRLASLGFEPRWTLQSGIKELVSQWVGAPIPVVDRGLE